MTRVETSNAVLPASNPSGQRTAQMALLAVKIITVLLLALGIFGWWCLAKVDAHYSKMVTETASSLNHLHEVGLHSFTAYGNIVELGQTRDPESRAALIQTVMSERAANDRVFAKLEVALTNPELRNCLQDVLGKRKACREQSDALIAATQVPDRETSLKLLRSYVAYQQACDTLTDRIASASHEASLAMTGEIRSLRWVFLGIGLLPILGALAFVILILTLLKVFKMQREDD